MHIEKPQGYSPPTACTKGYNLEGFVKEGGISLGLGVVVLKHAKHVNTRTYART